MKLNILRIKELMIEKGLNQRDLAKKSDINECTLSLILKGNKISRFKTISKLSKGLEVEVSEIVEER